MALGLNVGLATGAGSAGGPAHLLVEWTDASADEDGFRIEWSVESDFDPLIGSASIGPNLEEYTINNLLYNQQYYVRVYAFNGAGDSPAATTSPVTTNADIPVNLAAAQGTGADVDLTWDLPVGPNASATGYTVEYSLADADSWTEHANGVTDLFDTVTGLTGETAYDFRVAAEATGTTVLYSALATVTTGEASAAAPVGWWPLDDASGNFADTSGGSETLTANGTPTYSQSGAGSGTGDAITFDGSTEWGARTSDLGITGFPFTMGFWINYTTNTSMTAVCLSDVSADNLYFTVGVGSSRKAALDGRNTTFSRLNGTTDVHNTGWHFIAGVFRSATDRELYVNGVSEAGGSGQTSAAWSANIDTIAVGRLNRATPGEYVNGTLDEPFVYDSELSAADLLTIYNSGNGSTYP